MAIRAYLSIITKEYLHGFSQAKRFLWKDIKAGHRVEEDINICIYIYCNKRLDPKISISIHNYSYKLIRKRQQPNGKIWKPLEKGLHTKGDIQMADIQKLNLKSFQGNKCKLKYIFLKVTQLGGFEPRQSVNLSCSIYSYVNQGY